MSKLQEILDILLESWLTDIAWLSNWWMWVLMLPAAFYLVFMAIKWAVFTMPIWMPAAMIISAKSSSYIVVKKVK